MDLHPLLKRQLARLGVDRSGEPPSAERWAELLRRVSRAYEEADQERYLLERSQELASQEMAELYAKVRADHDLLNRHSVALSISEARLASLLSLSADWIWEQDHALRFTYVSPEAEAVIGVALPELLLQQQLLGDSVLVTEDEQEQFDAAIRTRQPFRDLTYRLTRPDGEHRYVRVSGEPVFDAFGVFRGYRGVGRDVTAATLAEQKVQELACYDGLTGLPNRNMFLDELAAAVRRSRAPGVSFGVCFIDLDRFKAVNDSLGHNAGDTLLRVMARRLQRMLRHADMVARLGGDEFVVLLEGGRDEVARAARRILAVIEKPVRLHGRSFQVTGSLGVSMCPADGRDELTLLKNADAAMYLAKARDKNNVQFYTAELASMAAEQFVLEAELRRALVNHELRLHYQPKVDVSTGRMQGVEALVRWEHPVRGLVPPGQFIPLAEERGLISGIGRWVVLAACRQIREWQDAGLEPPAVAVNLSAAQFVGDSFIADLVEAMAVHRVPSSLLEIELTESALMGDPDRAREILQQLKTLGVKVAIDDFGTGYSSLSYLKRVPAETVKIDRSFVGGLPDDKDDAAITQAVIAVAHSMGMGVVAEGVETEAQLQMLRQLGCDTVQGYLLGRPMPADQLAQRLDPWRHATHADCGHAPVHNGTSRV